MPGPWDRHNDRERGQISDLPMGGLLSELLASEGVDPGEFAEVPPESLSPLILIDYAADPEPAPLEAPPASLGHASLSESAVALPGLAAQLWALNQAASADQDAWPVAEATEPEQDPPPAAEAHEFALPGLLFSLTEEVAQPEPEPEPEPEPASAPEPVAFTELPPAQPVPAEPEPPARIVEEPAEEHPPVAAPLPHGRSHDLSNLIGAIDSELAAAPDLPPATTHEIDKTHERFVVFRLDGISYGLHMRLVREVERIGRVTQVPGAPRLICGLINLRGEILPLIDPRLLLELKPAGWPLSGYLVVVQPGPEEQPVALLVDELGGVALVDPAAVETDLADLDHSIARHALGATEHRGRSLLLLDHRNLVTAEALMASAASGSSN